VKTAVRLTGFFCALACAALLCGGTAAQAQDGTSGYDPYIMEYKLKAARKVFDSGAAESERVRAQDTPRLKAARERAQQLSAEKEKAEKEKEVTDSSAASGIAGLAQIPCQNLEDLLKVIVGQRRLGYLADAIDDTGIVHMWFMSRERREWVSLTVDHDLNACITAQGSSWHFALEPMETP